MHIEEKVGLLGLEPWDSVGHIENGYGEDEEEEIGGEVEGLDMAFGSVFFGRREGLVWC
jgi:hypothetical protein